VRPGEVQKKPKTGSRVNGNFEFFSEAQMLTDHELDSKREIQCRTVECGGLRWSGQPSNIPTMQEPTRHELMHDVQAPSMGSIAHGSPRQLH